jgi:hypothetical protein
MTRSTDAQSRGGASPEATAASDKAVLRSILTKGERRLKSDSNRLRGDFVVLKNSIGRNKAPVLAGLAALERDTKGEIRKLKAAKLHTPKGRQAQRLAIRTLALFDASLIALRAAFATNDSAKELRALKQAQQHYKQGRRVRVQASRALGFTWQV